MDVVTINGIRYTRRPTGTWAAGDSCYRVSDVTSDALDEIIRLRARIRELDQALSDAEWRLANNPPST